MLHQKALVDTFILYVTVGSMCYDYISRLNAVEFSYIIVLEWHAQFCLLYYTVNVCAICRLTNLKRKTKQESLIVYVSVGCLIMNR